MGDVLRPDGPAHRYVPYLLAGMDALLIRPDGCVAWALSAGQDLDVTRLVRALGTWFGHPV